MPKKMARKRAMRGKKSGSYEIPPTTNGLSVRIPGVPRTQKKMSIVQWEPTPFQFATSTSAQTTMQRSFQVAFLADTVVFASFDAYRITCVDLVYKPNSFTGPLPATASSGYAGWFAFDPDDNTVLTVGGVGGIAAKNTAVVHSLFEPWEMSFEPRPTPALYTAGTFSGYELLEKPIWVDSDNLTVPHYGFKGVLPLTPTVASGEFFFRYHVDLILNE